MAYPETLMKAKQAVDHLKAVKASLDYHANLKSALERKAKALKASVLEERLDVDAIKDSKAYSMFLSLRGQLSERMEKEEAEALVVKLLYDQTKKELADVSARAEAMSQDLAALPGCEAEYERLYEQRKQALINEGSEISRTIMTLSQEAEHANTAAGQINKALDAGKKVLIALECVSENLNKADQPEYYGGLGGLGELVEMSLTIRDYMDAAEKKASEAQKLFCEFKALAASTPLAQDALTTSGFVALDVLFNDVVAGRKTPDRVGRSKLRTETVISEMLCSVLKLRHMQDEAQSRFNGLKAQLDALVLSPGRT